MGISVSSSKTSDLQALDQLTGGAFTAATSGERSTRLREWLQTGPALETMNAVYHELSVRDKGAAKVLREKIDEIRRVRSQEATAAEWAEKARQLLQVPRLNIADAMAWQRDAAKAGAPLSREPLAALKVELADKVRRIEDLQHQVMVQREAAVLLTQRVEVLSTKPLTEARAARESTLADVQQWQQQARDLAAHADWPSVDMKYPPQLDNAGQQLQAVWDGFDAALAQAAQAWDQPEAALPLVPVWAEDIQRHRGVEPAPVQAPAAAKPRMDAQQRQQLREQATAAVLEVLEAVEKEVAEGHGKATAGAAAALRQVLKTHGRHLDTALDARVHAALTAAGELEGWQRWRADQIRLELVAKAEALLRTPQPPRPRQPRKATKGVAVAAGEGVPEAPSPAPADVAADTGAVLPPQPEALAVSPTESPATSPTEMPLQVPVVEVQAPASSAASEVPSPAPAKVPTLGGRKMQEALRQLREAWKQTDQGGLPNHALWKRFDTACNEAYKVVQAWLDQVRQESAAHRGQRLALIEEVKAWTASLGESSDWRAQVRAVHQFSERWRNAGHLSEKAFAELQPQWKAAIHAAAAPLEAAQKASIERRHALIEEAKALGAAPTLRIDAVKALQQRWQQEAQSVPLERKTEQKLWEVFRQPIDEAFQRKGSQRSEAQAQLSARDRAVIEASRALDAANAEGDATKIRSAMAQLEAALKGQALAAAQVREAGVDAQDAKPEASAPQAAAPDETAETSEGSQPAAADVPAAVASRPARPLVAVRGDDRPGQKKTEPASGKPGRRDARPGERGGDRGGERTGDRFGARGDRRDVRAGFEERADRAPRLGDAAFRAQREARERAELALRKLAAQAHGETLTQLMSAWQSRQAETLPAAAELGRAVNASTRQAWGQALSQPAQAAAHTSLLRLEMAAEAPTPAEFLGERRALQLQLLTRRHEPAPLDTWGQDVARVLAGPHDPVSARRLQNVLKQLLRR